MALCALAMPEKIAHTAPALLDTAVILHGMNTVYFLTFKIMYMLHVNMAIFIVYIIITCFQTPLDFSVDPFHVQYMYLYCLPSIQNSRQRKHIVLYFIVFIFVIYFWMPGMYIPQGFIK